MEEQGNWPGGVKKTKQRLLVYNLLECAERPLTAAEIDLALKNAGTPVWLSTIYRVLEIFTDQGIAAKTDGLDGGMALYELCLRGHKHYAVCIGCKKVTALAGCPLENCIPRLENGGEGFEITGHRLQVFGYCGDCLGKQRDSREQR